MSKDRKVPDDVKRLRRTALNYGTAAVRAAVKAEDEEGADRILDEMKASGLLVDDGCSEGGDCERELHRDCQPPDYHCSKCGRHMGPLSSPGGGQVYPGLRSATKIPSLGTL